MASGCNLGVIVWEWMDEIGQWMNYEPRVSDYIEDFYNAYTAQNGSLSPILSLDNVSHANTCLNLCDMTYMKSSADMQKTGSVRLVRRYIYPMDSPIGQGISWQWHGDNSGEWHTYYPSITITLEMVKAAGVTIVDLDLHSCQLPYIIDLNKMLQIRKQTGFVRPIQRIVSAGRYTKTAHLPSSQYQSNDPSFSLQPVNGVRQLVNSSTMPPLNGAHQPVNSTFQPVNGVLQSVNGVLQMVPQSNMSNGLYCPVQPPMNLPSFLVSMPFALPISTGLSGNSMATNFHLPAVSMFNSIPLSSINGASASLPIRNTRQAVNTAVNSFVPSLSFDFNGIQQINSGNNSNGSSLTQSSCKSGARSRGSSTQSKKKVKVNQFFIGNKHGKENIDVLFKNYICVVENVPANEDCCICFDSLQNKSSYSSDSSVADSAVQLVKCKHMFHRLCLQAMYDSGTKDGSLQCPNCKTIYGIKCGNCPPGRMEHCVIPTSLPSFEGCNTIQITYMIPPGIQGPEHPNPGQCYNSRGFPRFGYLPDNEIGQKILRLLVTAWERRLTFTIGTSMTTGETDTVVWNEIHHKTEIQNIHGHGYPDPNYLDNVISELVAQGVSE